jgi:hypothetical protein
MTLKASKYEALKKPSEFRKDNLPLNEVYPEFLPFLKNTRFRGLFLPVDGLQNNIQKL